MSEYRQESTDTQSNRGNFIRRCGMALPVVWKVLHASLVQTKRFPMIHLSCCNFSKRQQRMLSNCMSTCRHRCRRHGRACGLRALVSTSFSLRPRHQAMICLCARQISITSLNCCLIDETRTLSSERWTCFGVVRARMKSRSCDRLVRSVVTGHASRAAWHGGSSSTSPFRV